MLCTNCAYVIVQYFRLGLIFYNLFKVKSARVPHTTTADKSCVSTAATSISLRKAAVFSEVIRVVQMCKQGRHMGREQAALAGALQNDERSLRYITNVLGIPRSTLLDAL